MAYIAKTAFEARITNNEFNDLCNIAGLYQETDAPADCSAGLLCVRGDRAPCEGFGTVLNENTWYMNAAAATANADTVVYACNTYDVQLLSAVNGNNYAVGRATLGLGVPAGRYGNFTRIDFDNQSVYRFGEGNVNGTVGENKFFTVANGLLVPAAAAPKATGAIYFELRGTGNFTEGTTNSFGYYDLVACKVSTVAPSGN